MRRIAGVLLLGSVVALFFGLFNFTGHVQIGGDQGFILRGWIVAVGSVLMAFGVLSFLGSYGESGRIVWGRAIIPIVLMAGAGSILLAFGETPQEFCGERYTLGCP